jgi:hypothetical protein
VWHNDWDIDRTEVASSINGSNLDRVGPPGIKAGPLGPQFEGNQAGVLVDNRLGPVWCRVTITQAFFGFTAGYFIRKLYNSRIVGRLGVNPNIDLL